MKPYKLCSIFKGGKSGKGWYVYYYYRNEYGKFQRFRIKEGINREKSNSDKLEKAKEICQAMDQLLIEGFNPFTNVSTNMHNRKGYVSIKDSLEWAFDKKKDRWAQKTKSDFRSILNYFYKCINPEMDIRQFTRINMREALDAMIKGRGLGDNAYIKFKNNLGNLFEELVSWEKIENNPCRFRTTIKKPRPKTKRLLSKDERYRIRNYLTENNPDFFNYLMVLNHTALRPVEILRLKVGDVNLSNSTIILRAEHAKDKEDRVIIIPKVLRKYLNLKAPKHYYLFGYDFYPEERILPLSRDRATKLWHQIVKKELGINSNMYWLKDLGLTARRNSGMDTEVIQQIAGHSSYEMSQRYVSINRPEITKQIEEFGEDF